MTFTHALSTNNYGPAKFIVSANAYEGTHTTIAAALTSASSGDTIFIRPGTYTENLTLKAGVNLSAYGPSLPFFSTSSTIPNVIISGKATFTAAGTVGISGISLQTNSDFALAVTGSSASVVILNNCFINCTNNTGVSFTSSSASSTIQFNYCSGDIGTTGIAIFAHSAAGGIRFLYSIFSNTGGSTTNNTASGTGGIFPNYSGWANGLTMSSSSSMVGDHLNFTMSGNQTALTTSGTASVNIQYAQLTGGTSSVISTGTGTSVALHNCFLSSSNGNTIAGSGSLTFTNLTFNSTAVIASTVTQTPWTYMAGAVNNTQPAGNYSVAGADYFIGANSSAAHTITLPASPANGQFCIIKDITGTAATHNITVAGNGTNIDGAANYTIANNYGSISLIFSGTGWWVV